MFLFQKIVPWLGQILADPSPQAFGFGSFQLYFKVGFLVKKVALRQVFL
jgi:hypothetical protein